MKRIILNGLLFSLIFTSCNEVKNEEKIVIDSQYQLEESINRGKYLVGVMDCAACHTPKLFTSNGPIFDENKMFSGFDSSKELPQLSAEEIEVSKKWVFFSPEMTSSVGPWGISYSANISSDDTGIGTWTFEQFKTALTKGKYKGLEGSRDLLPPMPWQAYKDLAEEDLRAIFDYLKSTKPIENIVPPPTSVTQVTN